MRPTCVALACACFCAIGPAAAAPRGGITRGLERAPARSVLVLNDERSALDVRADPPGEPVRAVAEYAVALAAFTAVNLAGVVLANQATVRVSRGNVSVEGSKEALVAGAAAFALSPFAGALGSYLVGRGSDHWRPKLGWATLGGYGVAALALAGGYGIATTDVNRDTARALNGALYLAVPLGSVLLQNATRSPR